MLPIIDRLTRPFRARSPVREEKSGSGTLVALQFQGAAAWRPRDYATFAREGYTANPIVYRAVRMVAEAAASVPLGLFEEGQELDAHPMLKLLARPNPAQCQPELLESWYGFLLVAGNAYLEAVSIGGAVRELHVLRPDRMAVVPGSDGWPSAYDYTVSGRTLRYHQESETIRPILHQTFFHPLSDHYGLSPIEPAATSIDLHNAASTWNKALLDNAARPSGALVYAPGSGAQHLTRDQFDRLKAELELSFSGPRNAGRPMLLEGGLDWKAMALTPKDMDFIEAKNAAAREIALALGVPPMLLGIPGDNTYSNFQEANRMLWRQTVLPLVQRTAKALSAWLSPVYGGALELKPDLDQIEALSVEREALWSRVETASFLTVDEKRAAVGYGAVGDVSLTPSLADAARQ
ncbi:MAG: phage portal protein [Hyphomicrobiaceae bacterium]